ncbi:hypothetical protein LIER_34926 [Lithospermum erythrorhizon]|uniref:Transcription termination factor MTERF4, chloroplastic n=1 Tax=Lithospermum erythrorhizon TaxID=34254 RepID=A0AAV3NKT7_LITER
MKIVNYSGITKPNFIFLHYEMTSLMLCKSQVLSASTRCTLSSWKKKNWFMMRLKYSVSSGTLSSTSVMSSSSDKVSKDQRDRSNSPLYTHPSLLQMKNERIANRAQIYEFLRGIGIIPDELDGLEIPVTVDVMRERVDFLHKLGLMVEDINDYPLVLGCSVKKNMIPVLDYLGKLGVKKTHITGFLRRYPQVLHSSVVVDLAPVVKYLQGMDIKPIDIPRVLVRYPEVLGFKLEGTMSTSVAYLVGIGVSRRELGSVLTRYPEILGMRVGRVIKPFVEYLESLGIPSLALARLIEKWPHILGFGLDEQVKPNVNSLLSYNVKEKSIATVIAWYPEIMGIANLDMRLQNQMENFDSLFGFNAEDFGKIIQRMPQIVSLSDEAIVKHVNFLQQCGFSSEQVGKMVVGCPQLLALNLDIMGLSFAYLKNTMKRGLDELVAFPAFFTYGLESTVKPRHEMITKKGLKCSLLWLLSCTDEKFEERMSYDLIDMEEMEGGNSSFDMNSLMEPRSDDESASDYEEDDRDSTYYV